jgi:hypothetical protein
MVFLWLVSRVLLSWHREVGSESAWQVSLPMTSQAACATQLDRQFAMSGKTPCRGHQYRDSHPADKGPPCYIHAGGGVFNSCPPNKDPDQKG